MLELAVVLGVAGLVLTVVVPLIGTARGCLRSLLRGLSGDVRALWKRARDIQDMLDNLLHALDAEQFPPGLEQLKASMETYVQPP